MNDEKGLSKWLYALGGVVLGFAAGWVGNDMTREPETATPMVTKQV